MPYLKIENATIVINLDALPDGITTKHERGSNDEYVLRVMGGPKNRRPGNHPKAFIEASSADKPQQYAVNDGGESAKTQTPNFRVTIDNREPVDVYADGEPDAIRLARLKIGFTQRDHCRRTRVEKLWAPIGSPQTAEPTLATAQRAANPAASRDDHRNS